MGLVSLNLGIDFGTSFTKVCVRDTDNGRSWVVAFGKSKSCEESILSSLIGVMPDGRLVGGLTTKEWEQQEKPLIFIDFIKIRLAGLPPLDEDYADWQNRFDLLPKFKGIDLNKSGRVRGLAAFYLSRVIWRAKSLDHGE